MAGRQLGIAVEFFFQSGKAAQLCLARPDDALADLRRAFWNGRGAHFFVIHCWHINVNIDAVEQRPGNLRDVPLDIGGVQWHSRERSLKYPQGHGFMAAASMKRAGKVSDMAARAMHTVPSSSGWRITSSTLRGNSGSSSKKSTPLWASDTSPGRGITPPPISPASEMVWCGARNGRAPTRPEGESSTPATLWILVVSSASSKVKGGRIEGMRLASMVLPEPGGPIIKMLCPPAEATSSARLAVCCPRTSLKSTVNCCACDNAAAGSEANGAMPLEPFSNPTTS